MWAFIAYLIAATAFYTILVMIAQPDPYEQEAWELSDEMPLTTASAEEEVQVYRQAA